MRASVIFGQQQQQPRLPTKKMCINVVSPAWARVRHWSAPEKLETTSQDSCLFSQEEVAAAKPLVAPSRCSWEVPISLEEEFDALASLHDESGGDDHARESASTAPLVSPSERETLLASRLLSGNPLILQQKLYKLRLLALQQRKAVKSLFPYSTRTAATEGRGSYSEPSSPTLSTPSLIFTFRGGQVHPVPANVVPVSLPHHPGQSSKWEILPGSGGASLKDASVVPEESSQEHSSFPTTESQPLRLKAALSASELDPGGPASGAPGIGATGSLSPTTATGSSSYESSLDPGYKERWKRRRRSGGLESSPPPASPFLWWWRKWRLHHLPRSGDKTTKAIASGMQRMLAVVLVLCSVLAGPAQANSKLKNNRIAFAICMFQCLSSYIVRCTSDAKNTHK